MKFTRGLIVPAVIAAALSGCSAGTSYKARVTDYNVINPADLGVTVRVTNTGTSAGTPTCMINAQDPSGAYSGFDSVTMDSPLGAGQTTNFADNIVITNQGAQYVSQATVSCS